jgi:hypothetical protein
VRESCRSDRQSFAAGTDLRAVREAKRALAMGEREPSKAEQDGARTIKPFVAPDRALIWRD